jgi:regulatory protein
MAPSTDAETTGSIAPVTYLFGGEPVDAPPGPDASEEGASPVASNDRATRRAENVSLNGLTRRNMSRWEIEKLLTSRELPEDVIAAEVARLEGVGLIDDAALAETLVRTQRERKGLGRQAVIAELRRRHIDPTIIDAALEADDRGEDAEQERANELAIKKARALTSYDQETAKRRLTGFLMRKGYSSSIVRIATDTALNGRASGRTGGVQFR